MHWLIVGLKISVASTRDRALRDEDVRFVFDLEKQEDDDIELSLAQRDALSAPIRPLETLTSTDGEQTKREAVNFDDSERQQSWSTGYDELDESEFRLDSQGRSARMYFVC
jgi:hypothetical protein